jgi:glycosyltransferase involved in cell wall biosynthesis
MKPRSVAIVAGQLVVGGAERQLYLWLAHLDRSLFDPVVVTLHPGCGDYWEPIIEAMGIPVLRIPRRRNRIGRSVEIARALKPFNPELIHAWHLFAGPYAGAAAKMLGGIPALSSVRGSFASVQKSWIESMLAFGLTQGTVVNSESAGAELQRRYRWLCRNVHVVPNAVENNVLPREVARRQLRERWGLPDSAFLLGSMGRFEPLKRFDLVLEVAARLRKRERNVHVVLIGYGPQFKELHAKAEALGIGDAVLFTGADPEARRWLSALDAFCFLSVDEGLPNVVMEAAVAGVPVAGWRTPFVEELLPKPEFAMLVDAGNTSALEKGLFQMTTNAPARSRMATAAQQHVCERYGTARFTERMNRVYDTWLKGRRK